MAVLLSGCNSMERKAEIAKEQIGRQGANVELRNLTEPAENVLCGETRYIALSGKYGDWHRFHLIDGEVELEPFPPFIYDPARPPDPFYKRHSVCPELPQFTTASPRARA